MNLLEIGRLYANEWVVMDRAHRVIDHGPEFPPLKEKYTAASARLTFFFIPPETGN